MPTRTSTPYLLDKTSKFPMKTPPSVPMDPQQFATILIDINDKLNTLKSMDNTRKRILVKEGLEEHDTPTLHVVTPVIKKFSDIQKEFQGKSLLICDTQPKIEFDSEEFTYHPDIDSDFNEDVDVDLTDDQIDEN